MDETDRKRAKDQEHIMSKALPLLETFRIAIFDTIPDPLIVLDSDLNVLTANEAFYVHFKVSRDETRERSVFDIGNGQWNIPALKDLLEKILPEKSVIHEFEVSHEFPTIGERIFLVNAREIKGGLFVPLDLILVTFVDITDRKKWTDSIVELNQRLQAANEDLERYGQTVSHDLRVPVRAIKSFTEILLSDHYSELSENAKEYFDRVVFNVDIMDQMITGLSQLAGLSRSALNRIRISLSDIGEKIISQLKMSDPDRAVEVEIQRDMYETVDPSMFMVALTNIFKNSWKFTRDRSPAKISFRLQEDGGKKVYLIKDNGVGFDMKYAYKLFGMFQRLHSGTTFEGTGTGLAVVKKVIERHGGKVWIDSKEGEGTTLFFTVG
mgnify:CR=1 FL=1